MTQNQQTTHNMQSNKALKIERFTDAETTAKEAGKYINDLLTQHIETPILFLIAGGSAVAALEHINPEYLSPDITVTTPDDRFSTELDINNFSILQSTSFYNNLVQADAFCISTEPFEDETLEQYRSRFEKNLREWKQDFPKGIVIALYGMGSDGHTGGMIPGLLDKEAFDHEFNDGDRLVGTFDAIGYGASQGNDKVNHASRAKEYEFPQRISTTLPFMKDLADHAVFYITGEHKKNAMNQALQQVPQKQVSQNDVDKTYKDIDFSSSPISIIHFMKDAVVFTDISR